MQKVQVWTVESRCSSDYVDIILKLMFKLNPFLKESTGRESCYVS